MVSASPPSSTTRSFHLPCSAGATLVPAHSGPSSAGTAGRSRWSVTSTPVMTAATTARKPVRSRRASVRGAAGVRRRGSTNSDSTAAPAISAAMKR